jgi:hypothetical protein
MRAAVGPALTAPATAGGAAAAQPADPTGVVHEWLESRP